MTTNTPSALDFWQNLATSMCGGNQSAQGFWQAHSAFSQTVASIMAARGVAVEAWWQAMPNHMAELSTCTTPAQALECLMKWHAQTTASAVNLNTITQAERAHLLQTWQTLASRSTAASQTAGSHKTATSATQTAAQPAATSASRKATTGYGSLHAGAKTTASNVPNYMPGTFVSGQNTATTTTQPTLKLVEASPTTQPQVSSTATSFSRSAAGAAQVISATARRSVLARNASRPRRAGGSR